MKELERRIKKREKRLPLMEVLDKWDMSYQDLQNQLTQADSSKTAEILRRANTGRASASRIIENQRKLPQNAFIQANIDNIEKRLNMWSKLKYEGILHALALMKTGDNNIKAGYSSTEHKKDTILEVRITEPDKNVYTSTVRIQELESYIPRKAIDFILQPVN